MLSHIKDAQNCWTVILDNVPYTFHASHPEYDSLVECIKVGDNEAFKELVTIGTRIENWSEGSFDFIDGFLYYEDEQVRKPITERILQMIKTGWDHKPMLRFLDRLYENPSNRAVLEFYDWIQHKGLAIREDGFIVGYKGVSVYSGPEQEDKMGNLLKEGDLVDRYTGNSYRNNVGDTPEMKRRQVDDNCNNGCSHGLHVGTYDYANNWASYDGKVVLVAVDPANVVSIPTDCEFQKMRCWTYEVLAEARGLIEAPVYQEDEYNDQFDDEDDMDDDDDDDMDDEDGNLRGDF